MKNKILKEINVEEIMEEIKKNPKENRRFKVFWNGKKIEVDLEYYDFEKEIDEIKEKLENLKTLVENAEEWDKKIKDAAGEYILEDAQYWWEPSADYEDEDMPGLIEDLAEIVGKEEAEKMVNDEELSLEVFKKLRDKKDNKLETIICMEKVDDKDVIDLETAIEEGLELLKNGDKKYSKVKIKDDEMNIMLFTSGTTDKSKIVMLTQADIMANVYSIQFHVEITPKDTLLSFLPIHHTFENTITILLSMYKGGTVAFCDGLRHIADNLKEYKKIKEKGE